MSDNAKAMCEMLGCSGMDCNCPGNDHCEIIIKARGGEHELSFEEDRALNRALKSSGRIINPRMEE